MGTYRAYIFTRIWPSSLSHLDLSVLDDLSPNDLESQLPRIVGKWIRDKHLEDPTDRLVGWAKQQKEPDAELYARVPGSLIGPIIVEIFLNPILAGKDPIVPPPRVLIGQKSIERAQLLAATLNMDHFDDAPQMLFVYEKHELPIHIRLMLDRALDDWENTVPTLEERVSEIRSVWTPLRQLRVRAVTLAAQLDKMSDEEVAQEAAALLDQEEQNGPTKPARRRPGRPEEYAALDKRVKAILDVGQMRGKKEIAQALSEPEADVEKSLARIRSRKSTESRKTSKGRRRNP